MQVTTPIRLGILETGRPPEPLKEVYGPYTQMAAQWLAPLGAMDVTVYPVMDEVYPAAPELADLWLVTGSKCGVYEDHPWIAPLESFIRACHGAQVPMIGICFGHQIIAQAMGARVRKSPKGWGLGAHHYDVLPNDRHYDPEATQLTLAVYHQDQVETCPDGATVVAHSAFCPFAALQYGRWAFTTQAHPEFSTAFCQDLITSRRGVTLTTEVADAGLASLSAALTPQALLPFVGHILGRDG